MSYVVANVLRPWGERERKGGGALAPLKKGESPCPFPMGS